MRVIVNLIRSVAVLLVLVVLLFFAFFVNPGMLTWFSHDYAKLAEAYAPERIKLVNKRIEFDSELQDRRRDLADITQKLALTRGKLGSGKDAELQADLDQLLDLKTSTENQIAEQQKSIAAASQDIADIDQVIQRVQNQADDLYLVVRGVALGALGALAHTLVAFMSRRRPQQPLFDGRAERAGAAMLVGAIVSVILFAGFHTRQISIFEVPPDSLAQKPDFWRVSVLGLVAGAAASWVYHSIAASRRLALQTAMPVAVAAPAAPSPPPSELPAPPPPEPLPEPLPANPAPPPRNETPVAAPAATRSEPPKPAPAPAAARAETLKPPVEVPKPAVEVPKPAPAASKPAKPQPVPAKSDAAKPTAVPAPATATNVRWPPVAASDEAPQPAANTRLPAW
jgi:Skp family chaperone for outer membrane proteins/outer membrane biosynthesis protein TonB